MPFSYTHPINSPLLLLFEKTESSIKAGPDDKSDVKSGGDFEEDLKGKS
ncbi:MAG: hypothetical protein QWI73_07090 [Alphaproteobacteria bacterium]|nr:hypothetical protein [Alphaproteobacteria bacterium]